MWWPIRNQILVPFTAVLLIAVAVISVSSSVFASRRAEQAVVGQLNQMIGTLGSSSFPWSQNVIDLMRGLSGAEFVVYEDGTTVTTLPAGVSVPKEPPDVRRDGAFLSLGHTPIVTMGERRYFAAVVQRSAAPGATLLVLFPVESWEQARNEAAIPPLVVGGATLVLLLAVAAWLANRFGSRLRRVQLQVARIAAGDFVEIDVERRRDEIQELAASVNRMSRQLHEQQQVIGRTERTRLLGQLAGGIAHQLRNAATGARMAVQIHLRRCDAEKADDSLDVALRQLSLMEEQVRGLLSLGRTEHRALVDRPLRELLDDVAALVGPACTHHGIQWDATQSPPDSLVIADADGVRTALVNLILNAIDAAGPGGGVRLDVRGEGSALTFDVSDTGPGPPPEISENLFDLFVTGKPEGVGFGLALAKQVAERGKGSLTWRRDNGRTHFVLTLAGSDGSRA